MSHHIGFPNNIKKVDVSVIVWYLRLTGKRGMVKRVEEWSCRSVNVFRGLPFSSEITQTIYDKFNIQNLDTFFDLLS